MTYTFFRTYLTTKALTSDKNAKFCLNNYSFLNGLNDVCEKSNKKNLLMNHAVSFLIFNLF